MISTLLVDDEEHNRDTLRILLEKHCPNLKIIDQAANVKDAFSKIKFHKPKLVFLDIKMPGKSGFELLKMFPEIDFEVIFVTAYNKYAIKAFEFNALDYILKPIDLVKLIKAVEKADKRIKNNSNNDPVIHFVKTLSNASDLVNKFSIHHNGKVIFINIDDISCIEAGEDNTKLTLYNKTHYYSSKRLAQFETMLEEMENFIRINKSVMVNTNHIKGYTKGELCMINMKDERSFEVSRRRKAEILKKLNTSLI